MVLQEPLVEVKKSTSFYKDKMQELKNLELTKPIYKELNELGYVGFVFWNSSKFGFEDKSKVNIPDSDFKKYSENGCFVIKKNTETHKHLRYYAMQLNNLTKVSPHFAVHDTLGWNNGTRLHWVGDRLFASVHDKDIAIKTECVIDTPYTEYLKLALAQREEEEAKK